MYRTLYTVKPQCAFHVKNHVVQLEEKERALFCSILVYSILLYSILLYSILEKERLIPQKEGIV
jgi:hypothetical protein